MANLADFPGCCTAKIIVGLGLGGPVGNLARRAAEGGVNSVAYLESEIERLENRARGDGNAFVVATTNNEQEAGTQALINRGFAHSRWGEKAYHPETKVRVWYKRLNR